MSVRSLLQRLKCLWVLGGTLGTLGTLRDISLSGHQKDGDGSSFQFLPAIIAQ